MAKKLFCLINHCEKYVHCSITCAYLLLEKDTNICLKITAYNMKKNRDIEDKEHPMVDTVPLSLIYVRTPIKTRGKLRCPGRVNSYCYISGICYVTLVIKQVKRPEVGQDWIAILWSVIIQKTRSIYVETIY